MSAGLAGIIAIVDNPECRTKLIHSTLNRRRGWAGCLEHGWRHEAFCRDGIGLRMRRLHASHANDACENGEDHSSKIVGEATLRLV